MSDHAGWVAIVNPAAGGGRAADALARARSALSPIEVHNTAGPGHAEELARSLDFAAARALVVVGGDGTLYEAVNGLFARQERERPPLGILPAGTGDALARDLGVATPSSSLEALLAGHTRAIDVGCVEIDGRTRYVTSVVGWGAFARINLRAERLRWTRWARYEAAALVEIVGPRPSAGGPLLGVACLTSHTGRGMLLAPDARLDDGLADLVEVASCGRLRLLGLLAGVFRGRHTRSSAVSIRRVSELSLELEEGAHLVLDGEALPARKLSFQVLPGALTVLAGGEQS